MLTQILEVGFFSLLGPSTVTCSEILILLMIFNGQFDIKFNVDIKKFKIKGDHVLK